MVGKCESSSQYTDQLCSCLCKLILYRQIWESDHVELAALEKPSDAQLGTTKFDMFPNIRERI